MRSDELKNTAQTRPAAGLHTAYSIDGFRSLRDFSIMLNPGLNVLVGPNGSGKTNFIDFLDFLDSALQSGVTAAVSRVGGIARVFSQETIRKKSPMVSAKVSGVAELDTEQYEGPYSIFNYEYEIHARFSRAASAVYINKEVLRLYKLRTRNEPAHARLFVGAISVTRRSPSEEVPPVWTVGPRLHSKNRRNPLHIAPARYRTPDRQRHMLERFQGMPLAQDESFLGVRSMLPALDCVRHAVTRGRSFNIIPERARQPDDLTRPPFIMRDGSGLSSTLHYFQMAKRSDSFRRTFRMRRVSSETLDMVLEWTKLVFPELIDIDVVQDPHTGKYLGYLVVGSGNTTLRVSLQAASDGTLKWLCFVALLRSGTGSYSIEEPENFLHPKMQEFLVQLVRESIEEEPVTAYFILSTHSESLINQCLPEELVLFEFVGNRTVCNRLRDPERVVGEINQTGFGLGYYYASNALS